jgi:hypothetical protein
VLVVGNRVAERDFVERDLTGIRGVRICDRGLPRGTRWDDLDLGLLFQRLGPLEWIDIMFDGPVRLSDLGKQPALRILNVDCANVRSPPPLFPALERAHVRWNEDCHRAALPSTLAQLELLRPRMADLASLRHLRGLRDLRIHLARSLKSLEGLESLESLETLFLCDCPNLAPDALGTSVRAPGRLYVSGGRNAPALDWLGRLRKIGSLELAFEARSLRLPAALRPCAPRIDAHGSEIEWMKNE